nr:CstA-like transporter-associated (seleno)protein [Thauera linaloolentis]
MSEAEFERYSLGSGWLSGLKDVAKKVVQTCRLVIGIHDYEYYLDHMRSRHPEATPFTREEFYRYCLEARFPSAERAGTRCPC